MTDITGTVIQTASGETFNIDGGYLDIGILDTMKDLLVNFIGAVVFCSFGFAFLKYGEKRKVANKVVQGLTLKPEPIDNEPEEIDTEEIRETGEQ